MPTRADAIGTPVEDALLSLGPSLPMLELWPDPVGILRGGALTFVNPAFARYLGYGNQGELVGHPLVELVHPEDRQLSMVRAEGALASGLPNLPLRRRMLHRDGSILEAEASSLPVGRGEDAVLVILLRDLTERRRMEAQLAMNDRASALTALAAGIAHEINNPMSYVTTNLEFALEEIAGVRKRMAQHIPALQRLPEGRALDAESNRLREAVEAIEDALGGAERARRVVQSLGSLAADVGAQRQPLDLTTVIEAGLALVGMESRQHRFIDRHLESTPQVLGSAPQLTQVFVALVSHALDSLGEAGAGNEEVKVASGIESGGRVYADVLAPGLQLSSQALDHMFRLLDNGTDDAERSLGLSVAHTIVADHGGELTVRSAGTRGSIFRVSLPGLALTPDTAIAPGLARKRILVIDDEPAIGHSIERMLRKTYEIVPVVRAKEAVDRLKAGETFHLILCDLMMPEMTGMQFGQALSEMELPFKPPIIFMTAGVFSPEGQKFLARSDIEHFQKPFSKGSLRDLIAARIK